MSPSRFTQKSEVAEVLKQTESCGAVPAEVRCHYLLTRIDTAAVAISESGKIVCERLTLERLILPLPTVAG
jgi:hypothetical protein